MRYSHQKPMLGEDTLISSVTPGRVAGEIPLSLAGRTAEHRARTLLCLETPLLRGLVFLHGISVVKISDL